MRFDLIQIERALGSCHAMMMTYDELYIFLKANYTLMCHGFSIIIEADHYLSLSNKGYQVARINQSAEYLQRAKFGRHPAVNLAGEVTLIVHTEH